MAAAAAALAAGTSQQPVSTSATHCASVMAGPVVVAVHFDPTAIDSKACTEDGHTTCGKVIDAVVVCYPWSLRAT